MGCIPRNIIAINRSFGTDADTALQMKFYTAATVT